MVFIYVLQLKQEKWYIGKTETSKFRIDTHFDSKGSGFTKKYPPEEIYQIIPECDKYDEDKFVKKYMDKYGIDNVRGGSYSRLELTQEEKKSIQKELWGANDLCFLCGGEHFVNDCPNNNIILKEYINDIKIQPTEDKETERSKIKHYENELFELTEGCWVLSNVSHSMISQKHRSVLQDILQHSIHHKFTEEKRNKTIEEYNLSKKVYKKFNEYPIEIELFNRAEESDNFIIQKSKNNIKYYSDSDTPILIYIKYFINETDYFVYHYIHSRKYYPNYKYMNEYNNGIQPTYDMMFPYYDQDYFKKLYIKKETELKQTLFMLKNVIFDNKVYVNADYNQQRTSYQKKIELCVETILKKIDSKKLLSGTRYIQTKCPCTIPYLHLKTLNTEFNYETNIREGEENTLATLKYIVFTQQYISYIFTNQGNKTYTIDYEENNSINEFFNYNLHLIINTIQNYGIQVNYEQFIKDNHPVANNRGFVRNSGIPQCYANYHQTSSFVIILNDT